MYQKASAMKIIYVMLLVDENVGMSIQFQYKGITVITQMLYWPGRFLI